MLEDQKSDRVVLIFHGLWMHAPSMIMLAKELRREGFHPINVGYCSLASQHETTKNLMHSYFDKYPKAGVVAHSLGGVLALTVLNEREEERRVVCVASPLGGSSVAGVVAGYAPFGKRIIGPHCHVLLNGVPKAREGLHVGMIAGNKPFGLGKIVAPKFGENDGTVFLDETKKDYLKGHVTLYAGHTGILFTKETAKRAGDFLRAGMF